MKKSKSIRLGMDIAQAYHEMLKESKTLDRCIMGIRKAESTKRGKNYEER